MKSNYFQIKLHGDPAHENQFKRNSYVSIRAQRIAETDIMFLIFRKNIPSTQKSNPKSLQKVTQKGINRWFRSEVYTKSKARNGHRFQRQKLGCVLNWTLLAPEKRDKCLLIEKYHLGGGGEFLFRIEHLGRIFRLNWSEPGLFVTAKNLN